MRRPVDRCGEPMVDSRSSPAAAAAAADADDASFMQMKDALRHAVHQLIIHAL